MEEFIDVYIYRPIGYRVALLARILGLLPNHVTIASGLCGIIAGHFFYYDNWLLLIAGIILAVVSEILDCADGQLARLTGHFSQVGRILDGFFDNLKFISIYSHVATKIYNQTGYWWIFAVAFLSAESHSLQSAYADDCRNAYLYFAIDPEKSELHRTTDLSRLYASMCWKKNPLKKALMKIYLSYTSKQEWLSPSTRRLMLYADSAFGRKLPQWFKDCYRKLHRRLIKTIPVLKTHFRLGILFILLLAHKAIFFSCWN